MADVPLGSLISLISRAGIRYQGTLYTLDLATSSIALSGGERFVWGCDLGGARASDPPTRAMACVCAARRVDAGRRAGGGGERAASAPRMAGETPRVSGMRAPCEPRGACPAALRAQPAAARVDPVARASARVRVFFVSAAP